MPIVGAPSTTALVILDPVSEDAANVEVQLSGNYGLLAHAYPTPPVSAQWASSVSTEGVVLSSIRHENRTITITVDVTGLGALQALEAKLAKLYREGGTLKRVDSDGREIVFDVLIMDGYEPTFDVTHHFGGVTSVTFSLTCAPYGRGAEITLADHVETTLPVLIFTETGIEGDVPALGRLVIDNDQVGVLQKTLLWAVETTVSSIESTTRKLHNASTVALYSEFETSPVVLLNSTALAVGAAGASGAGSNVARQTSLFSSGFTACAVYPTSLIGMFRLFARVYIPTANTGTVQVRTRYSRFGQTALTANTPVTIDPAWEGSFRLINLGTIISRPITTPSDAPNFVYILFEALSSVTGDDIDFDYFFLLPADERSGEISDSLGIVDAAAATPSDGSVIVSHDGVTRYAPGISAGGVAFPAGYMRPNKYEGDYLLVPPAGAEGHGARFIFKFSRGVIATDADSSVDDMSARLSYVPRFLVVPSA